MYAIVDIETTGGYANNNRITEVAVFIHDGMQVIDTFHSLVNPERAIPGYITGLTGIDNLMVQSAPLFSEIADELHEVLKDKIFVAHNVHFDYSFIKREFEDVGYSVQHKKLCTVRLSRRLIPGLKSYGLGNLSKSLGIKITDRHRASGDAEATVKIFHHLLELDSKGVIKEFLKHGSKETTLPSNLPKEDFENLPDAEGVYYFHGKNGEIIYVGKAIDIKKRITGHFTGNKGTWGNSNIKKEIHNISYELTGNELLALLQENDEILRIWPKYNRAQKTFGTRWGLYSYVDQNGYTRWSIGKVKKGMQPVHTAHSHADLWQQTMKIIKEYALCSKLCGIQNTPHFCYDYESGQCDGACGNLIDPEEYNQRVSEAVQAIKNLDGKWLIVGKGRDEEESGVAYMDNGIYQGMGYVPHNTPISSYSDFEPFIKNQQDNRYAQQVFYAFLNNSDYRVFHAEEEEFSEVQVSGE